jgi:hypothetical protein
MDVTQAVGDEGDWYFTLDLHSAAPAAYGTAPSVAPVLRTLPAVQPVRQWLLPQVIGGWHAAAGLPRRTQIGASGVILYRVPAETNRQTVEEVLAFVETEGSEAIGRGRGFGLLTICDPFHLIMDAL